MKKILIIAFAILVLSSLSISAFAAPDAPVIVSASEDCYFPIEEDCETQLYAEFEAPGDGALQYQWYSTQVNDISTIYYIEDACGPMYRPPVKEGVMYYCVAAWNVVDGEESAPTYSRLIRVEYFAVEDQPTEPEVLSVKINTLPKKTTYDLGEKLDLKGMYVRVETSEGYVNSYDGEYLTISDVKLDKVGDYTVKVSYGSDSTVYDKFTVKVEHTHEFGEWEVQKEATCSEEGVSVRTCSCGEEETQPIPMNDHTWGEPVAKDDVNVFTCTVCGETKEEPNPDAVKPEDTPVTSDMDIGGTDGDADGAPAVDVIAETDTAEEKDNAGSLMTWVIVIAAVIAVAAAAGLIIMSVQRKKTNGGK